MSKKKTPTGGGSRPHNDNDRDRDPSATDVIGALTAWRVTLNPLINNLASQAQVLVASVEHVAGLCPPEHKDDKEAIEDMRIALAKVVEIVNRLRRLS